MIKGWTERRFILASKKYWRAEKESLRKVLLFAPDFTQAHSGARGDYVKNVQHAEGYLL